MGSGYEFPCNGTVCGTHETQLCEFYMSGRYGGGPWEGCVRFSEPSGMVANHAQCPQSGAMAAARSFGVKRVSSNG